jgi:hypothetical protein
MEHLLGLIAASLLWRMIFSIFTSLSIGSLVALIFPSIGTAAVFVSLLLGVIAATVWESSAQQPAEHTALAKPLLSKPVAFVGLAFIGALWGGLAIALLNSPLWALLGLAITPFVLGAPLSAWQKRHFVLRRMLFASCALLVGLAVPLVIWLAST